MHFHIEATQLEQCGLQTSLTYLANGAGYLVSLTNIQIGVDDIAIHKINTNQMLSQVYTLQRNAYLQEMQF